MNSEIISVIVPVYKVERYIRRCIDSILTQTYTNLEIILVDDGSPDDCGRICDEYAVKDKRVKVIHQENGGLSAARNAGLDIATGDYIGFVDSDDYIAPDMYEKLISIIRDNSANVAMCSYSFVDEYGNIICVPSPIVNSCISPTEAINNLYSEFYCYYVTVWNRLYESSIFSSIRFDVGKTVEDAFIAHKIYLSCDKIVMIDEPLYYYVQRSGSIMHTPSIAQLDEIEAFYLRILALKKANLNFDYDLANHQILDRYRVIKRYIVPKTPFEKERVQKIKKMVRKSFFEAFPNVRLTDYVCIMPFNLFKLTGAVLQKFFQIVLFFRRNNPEYILINLPNYGNLGDQAIALSEINLLKNPIKIEELYLKLNMNILKHIPVQKTVIISGGGFMGMLWPELEQQYIQNIIKSLPNNKIIIFPQSVTFDLSSDNGRKYFEDMSKTYKEHKSLTVFVRERKSYDFMKNNLPEVKSFLVPDMVLSLNVPDFKAERNGVLFCVRTDHEGLGYDFDKLKGFIKTKYNNFQCENIDNLTGTRILPFQRKHLVNNQLRRFASAKLIVTDRLHGMVFAAITGTPCIALDNSSGKVSGVYEWIKNNEYIRVCKDINEAEQAVGELDLNTTYHFDKSGIQKAMNPLYEELDG